MGSKEWEISACPFFLLRRSALADLRAQWWLNQADAMRMGPGSHLLGRTLPGGVRPEEFDYFVRPSSFSSARATLTLRTGG